MQSVVYPPHFNPKVKHHWFVAFANFLFIFVYFISVLLFGHLFNVVLFHTFISVHVKSFQHMSTYTVAKFNLFVISFSSNSLQHWNIFLQQTLSVYIYLCTGDLFTHLLDKWSVLCSSLQQLYYFLLTLFVFSN